MEASTQFLIAVANDEVGNWFANDDKADCGHKWNVVGANFDEKQIADYGDENVE